MSLVFDKSAELGLGDSKNILLSKSPKNPIVLQSYRHKSTLITFLSGSAYKRLFKQVQSNLLGTAMLLFYTGQIWT